MKLSDRKFLVMAALFAAFSFALGAQPDLPDPVLDPAAWFANPAALAAIVFAAVALAKEHIFENMSGVVTLGLSFAIGVGIAVFGTLVGWFDGTVQAAAAYGFGASLLASGGWDGVRRLLGGALSSKS